MSAQLSTYKRFLSKYATKLETVLTRFKNEGVETIKFPDEDATPLSINENQRMLEEGIGAIETCNTKIQETLQNYAIALDKNGSLSEKELDDFELYSNKVETVLSSSLDYIVLLKGRLNAFTSYQGARATRITSNNNADSEGAIGVKKIELPTLPIPTFYGDIWEWDNFWTLFDTNVNSQPLPDLYKFNYLIKALRGEPLQAVKKFRVSQDNYEKAVIFLKTKYGDKEQLINRLYERLEKLHLNSSSIRDQRKLLEQAQTIVAQLQEKNEHVDNQCMIKQVLSKFPNKLQRKVLERKYTQTENTFGMEILFKLLEEFITTEEKVSLFTREATPKQHPVSPAFPKVKEESTRWINNCMYCGEDHKAIACTKYTTPQSRAQYLREHKLCFICASPKHITTDSKKRMCFVCQGPHHTSCCFKKGQANENSPNTYRRPKEEKPKEQKSPYPQPKQQKSPHPQPKEQESPHPPQPKSTTPTSTKVHQTSEEAGNEAKKSEGTICELQRENRTSNIYLPTGEIQVMDPNSKHLRKIPVLLDTGAELSFIDKKLAEELHLPTLETTRLRLRTFGSEEAKESLSRKVELQAWDAEGQALQLQLLTYDTLTRPLKTPVLSERDLKFLQSLNLEAGLRDAQNSKPQILLGSDQLWQLIREDTPHVKLPSGLHLLPTRLGHLLTGQMYQEGQVTQVKEDDKELEIWDKYWSLESQVNGVVEEIKVNEDFKQAKTTNVFEIKKRSAIKARSSVPKQTEMKLTKLTAAHKHKLSKTSTNFRKMVQSTDEVDDLISIAKNKISKSLLLGYLVTAREELNNQTKICNTFRQDWDHTKQHWSHTKDALRDKITISLKLLRAATLARESYTKLCTRYILLAKWLGSSSPASNESEQEWIDDELLDNMKIMNKQMCTLVNELEKESDIVENLYQKDSSRIRQVRRQEVKKGAQQTKNEGKTVEQMHPDVPRVVGLVLQEQDVTMDDELRDKITQRRQLRQDIEEIEKALKAMPLRQLRDVKGGTHVQVTCAFCHEKNKHYSDSCPHVIDGDDRFRIAQRKGLCTRCLHHCAPGKCRFFRKSCFYCKKVRGTVAEKFRPRDSGHHKALCGIPDFEDRLRQKEVDARNEYQELEQEIQRLQKRKGPRKQALPPARRQEHH